MMHMMHRDGVHVSPLKEGGLFWAGCSVFVIFAELTFWGAIFSSLGLHGTGYKFPVRPIFVIFMTVSG